MIIKCCVPCTGFPCLVAVDAVAGAFAVKVCVSAFAVACLVFHCRVAFDTVPAVLERGGFEAPLSRVADGVAVGALLEGASVLGNVDCDVLGEHPGLLPS